MEARSRPGLVCVALIFAACDPGRAPGRAPEAQASAHGLRGELVLRPSSRDGSSARPSARETDEAPAFELVAGEEVLARGVLGRPAVLADGSLVVSVAGDAPGESELLLVPPDGRPPRVLFSGPGADDRPLALPDGRIVFVSTRTTVASLWLGEPATNRVSQLTNRGLSAGRPRTELYVPPPRGELTFDEATHAISYDGHSVSVPRGGLR